MTTSNTVKLFRRLLSRLMDWLDRVERKSPRAHKSPWHRWEFHVPSWVVAGLAGIVLYAAMLWGEEATWIQASVLAVFVIVVVSLFTFYVVRDHRELAKSDDAVSLFAVLFLGVVLLVKAIAVLSPRFWWLSPFVTPVPIAPLLIALLLHPRLAVVVAFAIAMVAGIINNFSFPVALVNVVGGVTIVASGSRSRTAHHVMRAGFFTGVAQMLVVFFVAVNLGWARTETIVALVSSFLGGVLASFFSLGAIPYLESFFSRTSNLRLLELADVNHPLLRQMSIDAPGTYHHSLIMASLAEDAANAIGANGLLCRVGAYFHDIGKLAKAEYFIENQGALGNPHDQVSPSLSKLVIVAHVKEGVALAMAHKLDKPVLDFIPQHHGTSQIEYFYHKALKIEEQQESDAEEVPEEAYRYPGPKPQTKEAGIVMLADSTEAASRTLEEPTHQRYKDLVFKIINKKLFDGQLDETSLTLKDLRTIGERFTATLTSIHHARIPYPETESPKQESGEEKQVLS